MFFGSISNGDNSMKNAPEGHPKDVFSRFPHHYIHQHQQQQQREYFLDEIHSSGDDGAEIKRPKTSGAGADADQEKALVVAGGSSDGATIEVAKRPRGRPPGSKNKPKPSVVITRESEPAAAMSPHVLEIPGSHDVVDSLARFSRRRNLGICVLAGIGAVDNVTLRQPSILGVGHPVPPGSAAATVTFHGRFEILSISATFLPPAMVALSPAAAWGSLSISLSGPQGQVVGGTVAGPLMASGTVVVMAAAFSSPTFHRLPAEDDVSVSVSVSGGGGDHIEEHDHYTFQHNKHRKQQQQQLNEQQRQRRHSGPQAASEVATPTGAAESRSMSIYSDHMPTEFIWAPTARPPPPPPY